jgi:hypothetical protein
VLIGIGAAIGSASVSPAPVTKISTVVKKVPVRGETQTVSVKVPVPGPTKTVTREVPAPPPPQGAVTDTFSGSGNQVTPAFNVPDDGDYIVAWSYSGNADPQLGNPSNFIITENGGAQALGLPNAIGVSGSGSTEVIGASVSDRLNVQATGQWTVTIKSA